ncbi:MAG TPA: GNAT family N-acetyltransferase [Gaiellaceae bacterium]|nr:GNAT family N-acetyltransferase [Gaiellaceae bacterium]
MPPARQARYGLRLRAVGARNVHVRRPDRGDAPRIAAFLSTHAARSGGETTPSATEVEHWLSLGMYVFWIAEASGELVGYLDANERPGRERYGLDVRSLGREGAAAVLSEALAWAEPRAAEGALVHAWASTGDTETAAVLEDAGFRHIRYELEMRIELEDEPPEPDWPDGIAVRAFRPAEDDEAVWRADQESFADHWEYTPDPLEDFRAAVVGHPGFDPELFFLAVAGEELAGFAFCLIRDLGEPVGWVDILGVRRPWRRRGLGLALLRHSFRELRARGAGWAGLEVDAENLTGAVRLYERAGMRPAHQVAIYERALDPARAG